MADRIEKMIAQTFLDMQLPWKPVQSAGVQ